MTLLIVLLWLLTTVLLCRHFVKKQHLMIALAVEREAQLGQELLLQENRYWRELQGCKDQQQGHEAEVRQLEER